MSNSAQARSLRILRDNKVHADIGAKRIYHALQQFPLEPATRAMARQQLDAYLEETRELPHDLPAVLDDAAAMEAWMLQRVAEVGAAYQNYLSERKHGTPRRYFSSRSHALYFLQSVAPTKLADGAWLYALLPHWKDVRLHGLIQTYLEELGDGIADKNHVALYQRLLATQACDQWQHLDDTHFVQGAIQLCLASAGEHYLPELIGYNLGYEQLPLHLLITSYELNELGIDPYYFTLHVTIDNAAVGHARKAVHSLQQAQPLIGDAHDFYRRVIDGYRLNDLGASTLSVIASFKLQDEVVRVLQAKAAVGSNMHSDYCRVGGRSVNDWLAQAERIPAFLDALQNAGWIRRGEPAEHSRFWRLIQGERAEMFGVFNAYEQQLLRDWIATPDEKAADADIPRRAALHVVPHRVRQHVPPATRAAPGARVAHIGATRGVIRGVIRRHPAGNDDNRGNDDFSSELRMLEDQLAALGSKEEMMQLLIPLMAPGHHHTPLGLMATRIFGKLFN